MRAFVFLLILANLLFLAWTQGVLGSSSNPDVFRIQQQLLADKIRIVSRDEPPDSAARTEKVAAKPTESRGADVCILLNDLSVADSERFESQLSEKLPAFKVVRTLVSGSTSYWISIPPLATKKDADAKVAELKKLGVSDYYIVQDPGPTFRAISLGLYSTRETANIRLEALRSKGIKTAKIVERNGRPSSSSLEIRGPEDQNVPLRQAVTDAFPEAKPAACKPPSSQ
jgi:hypothetical protein